MNKADKMLIMTMWGIDILFSLSSLNTHSKNLVKLMGGEI